MPLSWEVIVPSRVTLDNYINLLVNDGFGTALPANVKDMVAKGRVAAKCGA